MMKLSRLAIFVAMAAMLSSCRPPGSQEYFERASKRDASGRYAYTLDMSDTTRIYSLSLYTKLDESYPDPIMMDISFVSPSGTEYYEEVAITEDLLTESTSFFSKEGIIEYRSGFTPVEYGHWQMYISIRNHPERLCGMGVILDRKTKKDGQR